MIGADVGSDASKVRFLWNFVVHRKDVFAEQQPDGNYLPVRRAITERDLLDHVQGNATYGAYQIDPVEGTVYWVVYDIDDHDGDGDSSVDFHCVTDALDRNEVPYNVERSGSDHSKHVWVFFDEPVDVAKAHSWARSMIVDRGALASNCEVFPKQSSNTLKYGSLVKLPLGYNQRSERWSRFIDATGKGVTGFTVTTVDISGYECVPVPTKARGKPVCASKKTSKRCLDFKGIRPCIKELVEKDIPMLHANGHALRRAVATEFMTLPGRRSKTPEEAATLFDGQPDFDYERSVYQCRSLVGYHRAKCETIIENVRPLGKDVIDIDNLCSTCGKMR